jgi:hypothetical protein
MSFIIEGAIVKESQFLMPLKRSYKKHFLIIKMYIKHYRKVKTINNLFNYINLSVFLKKCST